MKVTRVEDVKVFKLEISDEELDQLAIEFWRVSEKFGGAASSPGNAPLFSDILVAFGAI